MINLTTSEKIKTLLIKRELNATKLAELLGWSRQNLSNKIKRNDFSSGDLEKIASALNCSVDIIFTLSDTSEKI